MLSIDQNRYLIRGASLEKITGKWKDAIPEIVEGYKKNLGDKLISVYIGGSVALGLAQENKSDIDSYAIVNLNDEEIEKVEVGWVEDERKRIDALFPFQKGFEIHLMSVDTISEYQKFNMQLLAVCIYGKDFTDAFPKFTLSKDTIRDIRVNIGKAIGRARKELEIVIDEKEIARIGAWIGKRLVRGGGMLVIWKEDCFTMNVDFLAKLFEKYYPEKQDDMKKALDFVKNPSIDKKEIFALLDSFGEWMIEEDKKIFG